MRTITTTIKREFLREIAAGRKVVEYREIKEYWTTRLTGIETPFLLRLINGMSKRAPEVTLVIDRVRKNSKNNVYELHIGQIVELKNWDSKREQPR